MVTPRDELVGFVFVMVNENNAAHLTTIGVAPEHRRRKIAVRLLEHLEASLVKRDVGTIMLEVRVSNTDAQELYRRSGYIIVQRIARYYNNGEDCFLMMKALLDIAPQS
jgi:ribosomal-protein-alanine N-acetyltransferase